VELGEAVKAVLDRIEAKPPGRVVFDSLSELKLLARDPLRCRRQMLALKDDFAGGKPLSEFQGDLTGVPHDVGTPGPLLDVR
jgi:circadian clock protein KaiC